MKDISNDLLESVEAKQSKKEFKIVCQTLPDKATCHWLGIEPDTMECALSPN